MAQTNPSRSQKSTSQKFRAKSTSKSRSKQKNRAPLKPQDWTLGLQVVHPQAAGIDVGNAEHWVAVPPHMDPQPVRQFGCFTADLMALADWLQGLGIQTVAMQSTGVYHIPLAHILAEREMRVFVVNPRETKNLPGRKTDIQECQWLLKLHVYGLLHNSFRPEEEFLRMRTYWRQRRQLVEDAARCIQRMQKALTQMNIQLANVISDISGWTGQAIIGAILEGERDPQKLAKLRDPGVKASEEEVAQSLVGNWREELLFVLRQDCEMYHILQKKIEACDQQLKKHYQTMEEKADPKQLPPCPREKRPRGNVPQCFDLRSELYRVTGVDLTAIDGINVLTAQTVLSEMGDNVDKFETEAQFVSYMNLSPNNKISGGKIIGRDKRKTRNRAGEALRYAALSLLHSESYLGSQYRRFRTRLGTPKAQKAMANKFARIIYRMLKYKEAYVDKGRDFYDQKYRQQQVRMLQKKAAELGLQLVQTA